MSPPASARRAVASPPTRLKSSASSRFAACRSLTVSRPTTWADDTMRTAEGAGAPELRASTGERRARSVADPCVVPAARHRLGGPAVETRSSARSAATPRPDALPFRSDWSLPSAEPLPERGAGGAALGVVGADDAGSLGCGDRAEHGARNCRVRSARSSKRRLPFCLRINSGCRQRRRGLGRWRERPAQVSAGISTGPPSRALCLSYSGIRRRTRRGRPGLGRQGAVGGLVPRDFRARRLSERGHLLKT